MGWIDKIIKITKELSATDAERPSNTENDEREAISFASPLLDPLWKEIEPLQERLGYRFRVPHIFLEAMTHRSYANENRRHFSFKDNDRLEFLGDAVLDLVVGERIFAMERQLKAGEMTKLRAMVVSSEALAEVAEELGVGQYLLLGIGERKSGGASKPSLLADAFEAVIGAVYIDGGFEIARECIERLLFDRLTEASEHIGASDHKSRLQEKCARTGHGLPVYQVIGTHGPDHEKEFETECLIDGKPMGHGIGPNLKTAEQNAASQAITSLKKRKGGKA